MADFDESFVEEEQRKQRSAILRVYNYYRILIGFLFLFLFLDPNLNEFVGQINPELFQNTVITYISINILIGLASLFVNVRVIAKTAPALAIIIFDIIALTLLMSASGGVSSGLGNFLIFTLAFGGGLIHGRVSTVLPAIAFILTIYDEFYLFFLDENDIQSFFQAGLLGIVYFVTNILFQTLSQQLRNRQTEVYTLEQINQYVIEGMRTGVVVINNDDEPRLMNNAASEMLFDPGASEEEKSALPTTLLEKAQEWHANPVRREHTFGTGRPGEELIATFSNLNSPESDTLVFLEDSTEVQRQAQQLKLAALGRLSASIAHEIRNPLGAISHAAQLLSESPNLDKGDARLCEIIQDHSVRMNGVIENVLQMSRRKTAEKKELVLDSWLDNFLEEFRAGTEDEPDFEINLEPGDTNISFDPLHLSQVMGNLCQNGLRYSKKNTGDARVMISGGTDNRTGQRFLEVIDFGEGVSEEVAPNLFEPFYTTETSGNGLGLYLSKEICAANDARLNYIPAATGGAAFRITFQD